MPRKLLFSLVVFVTVLLFPLLAQQNRPTEVVPVIKKAIGSGNYITADSLLKKAINAADDPAILVNYISLTGEINKELSGIGQATQAVLNLVNLIKTKNPPARIMLDAYREATDFFDIEGLNQQAYNATTEALAYAQQLPDSASLEVARCEYNLGSYAHRLGNIGLSQEHHRKALAIREADTNTSPENLYLSYNAIGSMMWYGSKYDSATFFYNKSLDALARMPGNDLNKYYRPAIIQNNLAGLYSAEGKTSQAIVAMQETIENYQFYIGSKDSLPKKADAESGLFMAIDNLAGIYKEIGDYGKAGDLLLYSYNQKKQKLSADQPDIFISEILLGEHYNSIRQYDKAIRYTTSGLEKLEKAEGDYLFWKGDAMYTLALVYENLKNISKATEYYQKSEEVYEESFQGYFDNAYMLLCFMQKTTSTQEP